MQESRVRPNDFRRAAIVIVAALSLAASGAPETGVPENPTGAKEPAAVDLSREPFVIERFETVYRFEADGTRTRSIRSRVRILTEGGLQEFGQLVTPYESGL